LTVGFTGVHLLSLCTTLFAVSIREGDDKPITNIRFPAACRFFAVSPNIPRWTLGNDAADPDTGPVVPSPPDRTGEKQRQTKDPKAEAIGGGSFFGIKIARDPYRMEIYDGVVFLKGGDGRRFLHGGAGVAGGLLPAPASRGKISSAATTAWCRKFSRPAEIPSAPSAAGRDLGTPPN